MIVEDDKGHYRWLGIFKNWKRNYDEIFMMMMVIYDECNLDEYIKKIIIMMIVIAMLIVIAMMMMIIFICYVFLYGMMLLFLLQSCDM